jgi:protein-S-isoprenylcysteine O-methyltransferase Ste14
MGVFIRQVPTIGILAVIYLLIAVVYPHLLDGTFALPLPSGAQCQFEVSDIFILLGLLLLYVEILKSTRSTRGQIVEHMTSMAVFVGCLLLYLLVRQTGTKVFLIITLLEALDVTCGFTVSIIAARRDMELDRVSGSM